MKILKIYKKYFIMPIIFTITVDTTLFGRLTFDIVKSGRIYELWSDNGYEEKFIICYDCRYKAQEGLRALMKEAMRKMEIEKLT
jgi:hypothetical protein